MASSNLFLWALLTFFLVSGCLSSTPAPPSAPASPASNISAVFEITSYFGPSDFAASNTTVYGQAHVPPAHTVGLDSTIMTSKVRIDVDTNSLDASPSTLSNVEPPPTDPTMSGSITSGPASTSTSSSAVQPDTAIKDKRDGGDGDEDAPPKEPPKDTEPTFLYFVDAQFGVEKAAWDAFIEENMPEGGITFHGYAMAWKGKLTVDVEEKIRKQTKIVAGVVRSVNIANRMKQFEMLYHTGQNLSAPLKPHSFHHKRDDAIEQIRGQSVRRRMQAETEMQLLSTAEGATKDGTYVYDANGGRGTTIFVIDSGFNVDHAQFTEKPGGTIKTYQLPNEVTGGTMVYPDHTDYTGEQVDCLLDDRKFNTVEAKCPEGHGTQVAAVAGGASGAAPYADLYLIKDRGETEKDDPDWKPYMFKSVEIMQDIESMSRAFAHVIEVFQSDPERYRKHSVVVYSQGMAMVKNLDDTEIYMRSTVARYMKEFQNLGILFVMAAGNYAKEFSEDWNEYYHLGLFLPQAYGTVENGLITVGAVLDDGSIADFSAPRKDGSTGSVTVYAQGVQVMCPINLPVPTDLMCRRDGSSFAAPAVGGMLATWLTIAASKPEQWPQSMSPLRHMLQMKKLLTQFAWTRRFPIEFKTRRGRPSQPKAYGKPPEAPVAFNGYGSDKICPDGLQPLPMRTGGAVAHPVHQRRAAATAATIAANSSSIITPPPFTEDQVITMSSKWNTSAVCSMTSHLTQNSTRIRASSTHQLLTSSGS